MKRWTTLLAGLAFVFAVMPAEEAEAQVMFGPQVSFWDFEELGIGARVDFGLGDTFGIEDGVFQDLFGSGSVNFLLSSDGDGTPLQINFNAAVPFDTDGAVTPYAGAGINHYRVSSGGFSFSSSGLNLLGGVFFDLGGIPAFGELQYSTTWFGYLTLSGGVLFGGGS